MPCLILWSLWSVTIQEKDDITIEAADVSLCASI